MDRMLFVLGSGAKEIQNAQAVNANNLANVATGGFKADLAQFRSMQVFGPGAPSRVYAMAENPSVDMAYGRVSPTGRELDVAIQGDGFIAVQTQTGEEAYTRAGNLRVASDGVLTDSAGRLVLGNGGPITVPQSQHIEISIDGTVSVQPVGQAPSVLAEIGRIKLVKPDSTEFNKGADGLFHLKDGGTAPADASVKVIAGALESSNVNAVESMVNMIELARSYEMQIKMIGEAKGNDEATDRLMRMA